jgi:Na+-translocating ferredoxin:NAD+ oxidoreductase RnfD subunit
MAGFIFGIALVSAYLALPVLLVWGWVLVLGRHERITVTSLPTHMGFALISASSFAWFAVVIFPSLHSDAILRSIVRIGGVACMVGFILALAGLIWRSRIRWHAPICGLLALTLMFVTAWVSTFD